MQIIVPYGDFIFDCSKYTRPRKHILVFLANTPVATFIMKVRSDANFRLGLHLKTRSKISIGTNLHYEGSQSPTMSTILTFMAGVDLHVPVHDFSEA